MADSFSQEKRSKIMSRVKSNDSAIEIIFRKELWKSGFRYRKNSYKYFGKPDVVLKKYKAVIFIDSCFWHGCSKHLRMPSSNKDYWSSKIERNIERDKEVGNFYKSQKWKIIRIWEHDLSRLDRVILKLKSSLNREIL